MTDTYAPGEKPHNPPKAKKKAKPYKSTRRALDVCEERKWIAGLVERRLPHTFTTVDFLGFADIIALDDRDGSHAIQACQTDVAAHFATIRDDPKVSVNVARWLARGNRLSIWAFRKLKYARGSKAFRWKLREIRVALVSGAIVFEEVPEVATP